LALRRGDGHRKRVTRFGVIHEYNKSLGLVWKQFVYSLENSK